MSFPKVPFVIIRYGPYKAYGTIDHRTQKLNGLCSKQIVALTELGYEFVLAPINEYNRMCIEMFDREIFRCDIRNLMFNMPVEEDPVCQRALAAVEEAQERMGVTVEGEENPVVTPVTQVTSASSFDETQNGTLNEFSAILTDEHVSVHTHGHDEHVGLHTHEEAEEKEKNKVKIMFEKNDKEGGEDQNQLKELYDVRQVKPEGDLSNIKSELSCFESEAPWKYESDMEFGKDIP